MSFGSLSDIRIVDLTQMLAGPYGTMMLADHGAEVIKVEPPAGDMTRPAGPFRADDTQRSHAGYFQSINRNKKSVILNLKSEAGRSALKAMVHQLAAPFPDAGRTIALVWRATDPRAADFHALAQLLRATLPAEVQAAD